MAKISIASYSIEEERGFERLPHKVSISLKDGTQFSVERLHANGAIEAPLTKDQKKAKFRDCIQWAGRKDSDQLYGNLKSICSVDSVKSVSELITRLLAKC